MMYKVLVLYKFEQYNVIVSVFSQHVIPPQSATYEKSEHGA